MSLSETTARLLRGAARRLDPPARRPTSPSPKPSSPASRLPDSFRSEPGTRVASQFFGDYPRYYSTGAAGMQGDALNVRYEAMIEENKDLFEGARVLDIACHDGRWSMAALANGAKSVVGIEAQPDLVEHAVANMKHYGQDPDRFRFIAGDVHEVLNSEDLEVDVVLCLGFLYHTLRYNELLYGIHKTGAEHLIIDTQALRMLDPQPSAVLLTEPTYRTGTAKADAYTIGDRVLTGRPNLAAMKLMLDCYGYEVERLSDWPRVLADNPGVKGVHKYATGRRITMRCRKTDHDAAT